MSETGIEKRGPSQLKEKGQYALAFSVIAAMLYFAGFPVFLLFFVGVLTFFIWKVFSAEGRTETRRIFEFYLSANEILRDDDRRWYGFEIQETIARGESIVRSMNSAPPLVHFALGALYQQVDDHSSAVKNLSQAIEASTANESAIVFPTRDLREYVRMLRRIERAPAEAPLTSSAIRSLERTRKNRGNALLQHSRVQLANEVPLLPLLEQKPDSIVDPARISESQEADQRVPATFQENGNTSGAVQTSSVNFTSELKRKEHKTRKSQTPSPDRKTISEVLHDIYDENIVQ